MIIEAPGRLAEVTVAGPHMWTQMVMAYAIIKAPGSNIAIATEATAEGTNADKAISEGQTETNIGWFVIGGRNYCVRQCFFID